MLQRDRLITTSRLIVRAAWFLNRFFLAAVVLALPLSWVFSSQLTALCLQQLPRSDVRAAVTGLRLMLLVGIVMAVAIERLLRALGQIIESARAGDPFNSANARRLQAIGWALLVLQLLDIPAAMIERSFPGRGMGGPDPVFSFGGWMAVLMVFVLSRVFTVGSAMRDELEGTV